MRLRFSAIAVVLTTVCYATVGCSSTGGSPEVVNGKMRFVVVEASGGG